MKRADELERALRLAVREIQEQQDGEVEDACLPSRLKGGKPDLRTIDKLAKPYIAKRQKLLDRLNRVLGRKEDA